MHAIGGYRTPMAIKYTCEGCGRRVAALAIFQPPAHGFCVQCAFLCEYIPDPAEMLAVHKALDADREAVGGIVFENSGYRHQS
jgi:hypothetical protein